MKEIKTSIKVLVITLVVVGSVFLGFFTGQASVEGEYKIIITNPRGVMVLDNNSDLVPYRYIPKWNVYKQFDDTFSVVAISGASCLYSDGNESVWVQSPFWGYHFDN